MKPIHLAALAPLAALAAPLGAQNTMLVSRTPGGFAAGDGSQVRLVGDGRFITYSSREPVLPRDTNELHDVYLYDRLTGETELVSVASEGGLAGGGQSSWPSADGRFVVFQSSADDLVPDDTNGFSDVFLRDRLEGTTERISVGPGGIEANGKSFFPRISGDGSTIVFASEAQNIVAGSVAGVTDIFALDRETGEMTQVTVSTAGFPATGYTGLANISYDGRYVCFESDAPNLVMPDANGTGRDVFVRDRELGTTVRVNESADGVQSDACTNQSAMSSDGSHVVFISRALNLVPGLVEPQFGCYVKEVATGAIEMVHAVPTDLDPCIFNASLQYPRLSSDGRYVAYYGGTEDPAFTGTYRVDRWTGEKTRVDVDCAGNPSAAWGSGVAISDDGVYVGYSASGALWPENVHASAVYVFGPDLPCAALRSEELYVSVQAGGLQRMTLDAGKNQAERPYLLLGSTAGTHPGISLGGHLLPLAYDGPGGYFAHTVAHANEPPLAGSLGVLDFLGEANAVFSVPAGSPSTLVGLQFQHAFLVVDPETDAVDAVSTPLPVTLVP